MEFGDDTYDSLVILPPRGKTSDTEQKEPFLSPPKRSPSPQLAPQPSKSLTSKLHVGQCRGRVGICRQTHLPPLCGLSFLTAWAMPSLSCSCTFRARSSLHCSS